MTSLVINFFHKSKPPDDILIEKNELVAAKSQQRVTKNFFKDEEREIDFILVCQPEALNSSNEHSYISTFIENLENYGLQFELEIGTFFNGIIFIKVHGPSKVLLRYASAFKIKLAFRSLEYPVHPKVQWKFMATELTKPNPDSSLFKRAVETLSGQRPTKITTTERIMIVHMLLERASFGNGAQEYGLKNLLERRAFAAAYPLHDGRWEWTDTGPLNNRQLLAKYWANMNVWYKEQPLDVVEKYYGPEVAFYFAFCGFYNRMLIPASIVGFFCFIFGFVATLQLDKEPIEEICSSDLPMCPVYFTPATRKQFKPLSNMCFMSKLTYMFDNTATVIFAFFMAFWATIFMELWKRKHTVLMQRWNLSSKDTDFSWRREFAENTKYRRVCEITGNLEPYVPKWIIFLNYSVTLLTCTSMIFIVMLAVLGTILYRMMISSFPQSAMLGIATASLMSVVFIKIFGKWYSKISFWLTTRENPRTQTEFDDSFIYKLFLLSFFNNYAAVSYMAFFKGKLYTYPGDSESMTFGGYILVDQCHPAGCIVGLCIQLAFIVLLKSLTGNIFTLLTPLRTKLYRKCISREEAIPLSSPQWELDYDLNELGHYFLVREYMEIVMQYGFVTFFAAAFPLAPLCAFISNMLELRGDASKFVKFCRRPVPVKIKGLDAWNGILQAMTFMSMVTNTFVIAFTNDFVKRQIYRYQVDQSLRGYINSTLSRFDVKDFRSKSLRRLFTGLEDNICYYRGNRYPPEHPKRYKLTASFWVEMSIRFIVAVIFEHILLTLTGILGYAIPDMTYSIKKQINHQHFKRNQERVKAVDDFDRGRNNRGRKKFVLPTVQSVLT